MSIIRNDKFNLFKWPAILVLNDMSEYKFLVKLRNTLPGANLTPNHQVKGMMEWW